MERSASHREDGPGPDSERRRREAAAPPLVVLAGSDSRPGRLTEEGRGYHPLSGYKGASLFVGGQPLAQRVLACAAASGRFSSRYLAGPGGVYRDLAGRVPGTRLVDCDGRIDANLRAVFQAVRKDHPHGPIAFLTCDVVPEVEEVRRVMDRYEAAAPCDVFFPLVKVPPDPAALGASAWKPRYRIRTAEGAEPCTVLPGHLIVVDPDALRLGLVYRLIALIYLTRNRPIGERRHAVFRGLLGHALREDLRHLVTFRLPELTATLAGDGAAVAMGLKSGNVTTDRLERVVRRVVVSYGHRRRYPRRRVELPVLDGALSLALDIDTEEEARATGAVVRDRAPPDGVPPAAG